MKKQYDLLIKCHTGSAGEHRHRGQITVDHSNTRWCSDSFEITCENKEKVRVSFALDCFDREATAHLARREGIKSEDMQELVITAVENRFRRITMLAEPNQWLTDNDSCFIAKNTASCSGVSAWNSVEHKCSAGGHIKWPRLSSRHSRAIMPGSIRRQTPKPSWLNCQYGSSTIIIFTRTKI
ncbi:DDE-type integrase/transposase/recombinase [Brucella sp. NBRC 12952]|uniref:DDE-type integrase/transposase/recombinase n=1 Tax=Brucella sp. NBRC 12952 TaxID=3075480 RepID=UPI003340C25C